MVFDIVVIGGGIIGSAAAHFLAKDGRAGEIAVIEPDPTYAHATTPQGAGGVRQLFSLPENIAMSQFSLAFYESFDRVLGGSDDRPAVSFRRQGYLFVVGDGGAATLAENHKLQSSMGVRAELLDGALRHWAGWAGHRLAATGGGFSILAKQVNLIDCDRNLRNPSLTL